MEAALSSGTLCAFTCAKGIKGSWDARERSAKMIGDGERDGAMASIARLTSRPTRVVERESSEETLRRSRTRRWPAAIMRQRVKVVASMFSGRC